MKLLLLLVVRAEGETGAPRRMHRKLLSTL